jgi:DNA polymerase III subunit epsilon
MHIKDTRLISVDIETTGLNTNKDEIIAIACIPIYNTNILFYDLLYTLVRPYKYNIDSMKYHGISEDDLKSAPPFIDVADNILKHLDGILLGFSVEFDYLFLRRQFKAVGVNLKRDFIDIALVERWLQHKSGIPEADLSFETMMDTYGLRQYYRHNALADAFFSAQIFQMQMGKLLAFGIDSPAKILKLTKTMRYRDGSLAF